MSILRFQPPGFALAKVRHEAPCWQGSCQFTPELRPQEAPLDGPPARPRRGCGATARAEAARAAALAYASDGMKEYSTNLLGRLVPRPGEEQEPVGTGCGAALAAPTPDCALDRLVKFPARRRRQRRGHHAERR